METASEREFLGQAVYRHVGIEVTETGVILKPIPAARQKTREAGVARGVTCRVIIMRRSAVLY